jgi:NADH-quinone oxidoreductase subunit G
MPDDAPEMVTLSLNGRQVEAPRGMILVDAAARHGVEIPIFCYEPRLGPPIGACRMCLVEIEGMRGLQTACSTPVSADMVVRTDSPAAKDAHDGVLELLLANHPLDCPVCDKGGECPLQDRTFRFGPGRTRFAEMKRHFPKPLDLSPLVAIDRERCITCFRCIRFSQEVAEDGQLTFQERGAATEVATFTGDPYLGRFTGNIIDICPVGALTSIPYRFVSRPWDVQNAPSLCAQCPVGCNTELTVREGEIKRVTGREVPNLAVEEGWLCDKGRWASPGDRSPDRLVEPVVRDRVGRRAMPIERALGVVAGRLLRPGTRAAVLVGGAATLEEAYVARRIAGELLGGAPVARLGIPGHGLDALRALPAAQLGEVDGADLVVVVGGDPAEQQPVTELRIRKARRLGARVVCVGPRPHALEALGASHRSRPGALAEALGEVIPLVAGAGAPVVFWDEADLAQEPAAARALAEALDAHATARQIELGSTANGAGLRALGLPASGVLEALEAGEVDVLILVQADPLSAPGAERWRRALEGVSLVEIATHHTGLTDRADVVLPALSSYEVQGTLVSMNGRVQRLRPGGRGPEGAAAAWELLVAITHRMGAPLEDRTPAHIFRRLAGEHAALAGLTYEALGTEGVSLPGPLPPVGEAPERPPDGEGLPLVGTRPIFGDVEAARSDALDGVRTGAECVLHPEEAARAGVARGPEVALTSPHGGCVLPLRLDPGVPEGVVLVTLGVPGAGVESLLPADHGPVRVSLVPVPALVA